MNTDNRTFWSFTVAIVGVLLIPTMVQEGMFLDGVTYSAISKNMAHGYGTFWNPHYTQILYPDFHEHPPLVFIIQSFFFRVLGDGFLTERIFSFLSAVLTIVGIEKCWKLMIRDSELRVMGWLPVFLWITIPLVSWAYKNNILENLLSVFTTFAVYFILKSIIEKRFIFLLAGSVLVIFSFLSKGAVGLFSIAIPVIFLLVYNQN